MVGRLAPAALSRRPHPSGCVMDRFRDPGSRTGRILKNGADMLQIHRVKAVGRLVAMSGA